MLIKPIKKAAIQISNKDMCIYRTNTKGVQ